MAVPTRQAPQEPSEVPGPEAEITAHRTTLDRTVFTESDNTDGWIATDLTVELER